jgi:hypothetical protein
VLMALGGLCMVACGRTDPLWWADIYASDSGTEDQGDGDGDGDGDTSTTISGDGDGDPTETDTATTTTTTTTDTDTDTDTATTETTTESTTETTMGCEDVPVGLVSAPSTAVFLLDQGGHMGLNFDGQTRWEAIGQALFGMQAGVVWAWEGQHRLGLLSFTSQNGNQGPMCPITEIVAPQPNNGAALDMAFAGLNPVEDNPVAEAIDLALPLFGGEPGHLILLTGRNPDTCAQPDPQQGADAAVTAAAAAFAAGVRTHFVEVGNVNGGYAQALANAGAGLDPQQGAEPFASPVDTPALVQALDGILAGLGSCELLLDTPINPGGAEFCTLELDGMVLGLDDPDGWSVIGADRAVLQGAACDSYAQGATPAMICGCEAF